jgi:tartrate dehydratase beta subunit/fumarate hydratase class I family protein
LQKMRIPELMHADILSAFFKAGMTVPTHRDAWERFRLDFVGAAAQLFSPAVEASTAQDPLLLPHSLLIRDIAVREYDFFVTINSKGMSLPQIHKKRGLVSMCTGCLNVCQEDTCPEDSDMQAKSKGRSGCRTV